MKKTLIETLKEKYGSKYNFEEIEEVEHFNEYNITHHQSENGDDIYRLRIKSSNGDTKTTWHTSEDTIVSQLFNYEI